jgi:protoporphyrinogen/coproporphyrinogen III oxidase
MKQAHAIILGAGISGLAAAFFLQKRFPKLKITIFEKTDRVGGFIRTQKKEGFLFEEGPRAFYSNGKGKKTLELVSDLNLQKALVKASAKSKKRYLYTQGILSQVNLLYLLKQKLLFPIIQEFSASVSDKDDESIEEFFSRRFNKKLTYNLIDPLVRGIFGGDIKNLSIRSCFPLFYEWEKQYGSLIRGYFSKSKEKGCLLTFEEGMETLPKAIGENCYQWIHFKETATHLEIKKDQVRLQTTKSTYEADLLIAAIPYHSLSPIFPHEESSFKMPFLSLTSVSLGFYSKVTKKKGFGYLVPSQEHETILGMTWDSKIFPTLQNGDAICIMLKGEHDQNSALEYAKEALVKHMSIKTPIDVHHISLIKNAIPQYPVGHFHLLKNLNIPPLFLLGNSYFGVGINDCIAEAAHLVRNLALQ